MADAFKRLSSDMNKLIQQKMNLKFKKAAEKIKEAIIAEYDEELVDVVTDRNSKTNPNFYREEFIERLNQFEYIEQTGEAVSINVPTMETFDFSGRMSVIETIMEGVAGTYIELNEVDYKEVIGRPPIPQESIDKYVSPKERIYLVRLTTALTNKMKDANKKIVRYPFSNTPPIKILEEGERFVDDNMSRWIEEALEEAQKEFVTKYRGAKI
jgi:hypothetical protein